MCRHWFSVLLVALALRPEVIAAAELRLSFDFASKGEPEAEVPAELVLRKSDGGSEAGTAAEGIREVFPLLQAPEKIFELEPATWLVELDAPGYWSEQLEIALDEGTSSDASFVLWPSGVVQGHLAFAKEAEGALPDTILLGFTRPPGLGSQKGPRGSVRCPVLNGSTFECEAPAGELDLKLSATDFSSAYLWNVKVQRGKVLELGSVELGPATGIIGWVATEERQARLNGVEIEVKPRLGRPPRKDAERVRTGTPAHGTTANERGFFQLQGLAPGAYVIHAKKKPFALTTASVRVEPGRVTEIVDPPLILRKPRSLQVFVDPPVPPERIGGVWSAKLIQLDQGNTPLRYLDTVDCSFSGSCEVEALSVGKYKLRIESSSGKSWFQEDVIVDANKASHIVEIPVILVQGTLTFRDEPLAASIFFGTKSGGIEVVSNEEGRFEGFLPRPGDWRVEVRARTPKLRRYFEAVTVEENPWKGHAEVDLALPSTYLDGIVVDEQDVPVPGAIVTARGHDLLLDSFTQQGTDASGRFEFQGLPAGKVVLRAAKIRNSRRLQSHRIEAEIEEEVESRSLKLVLRQELRLRGRVVAYGRGVPDASVKAHSTTAMDLSVSIITTDAGGYFEIGIPAGSREVLLGIGAPGFGYKMARSRLTPGQELVVSLEQAAGTLVIELGENAAKRPRTQILAVLHNGSMEAADYLQRAWAPLNEVVERDPGRYVLPRLETGVYSVCVTDPLGLDQLAVSGTGGAACPGGYLPAGGELVLDLRRSH